MNGRNDTKFIQNKMGKKKSQNIRRKRSKICNGKVKSSGSDKEAKKEGKGWRKCHSRYGLKGEEDGFFFFFF